MKRHTILVIDDEPDVVKSVQDLLRLEHRVLGATRASEGLKILNAEEVHIVMTDQRMPEMSGVEFLRRVRGDHPEAIRLLFTGYSDIRAVIDAINQGSIYRYITKPWDPDELQAVIRGTVEHYDLLVERRRLLLDLQTKNVELQGANEELRQISELKTTFIRVASHELRTPLTILLGMAQLALRMPNLSADMLHLLQHVYRGGKRLERLVDMLLAMLSAGQFAPALVRREVDIKRLLEEAADDIRPFIALRHQELVVEVPSDLGTLSLDRLKIRDAINQLLLNAIKFTPNGGRILLGSLRLANGKVEIRVSDNGIGIDSISRHRLFEPFFTGMDASTHSSGIFEFRTKGIGLGLSVVKAFVELHGGSVEIASELGQGTTATLLFLAD